MAHALLGGVGGSELPPTWNGDPRGIPPPQSALIPPSTGITAPVT
jgi:hypothetical protein